MSSTTDPIADLLTRIRNANTAQHRYVDVLWSKIKENLIKILKDQGFVAHYLVKREGSMGTIRVFLKYYDGRKSVIQGLKRVSSPGLRRYVNCQDIPLVLGGMGVSIISTSKGIMIGSEARQQKLGGELLCLVW